jgi:hypothetical protein
MTEPDNIVTQHLGLANLSVRVNRVDARLDRIEQQLAPIEA